MLAIVSQAYMLCSTAQKKFCNLIIHFSGYMFTERNAFRRWVEGRSLVVCSLKNLKPGFRRVHVTLLFI